MYTINPATGAATFVGSFGSPPNLNGAGQNIRFAGDGNLYDSNGSTSPNTDIYRINTTTGAATWMGEAVGYSGLGLGNANTNMYGVYVNLGSGGGPGSAISELVAFDLTSFVVGGTNANGSTHQITVKIVGAGTNFPPNFAFSGIVPQGAITNPTVPVTVTVPPANQTTVAGSNATFSVTATGTDLSYEWLFNDSVVGTNSSLTLNNVTTSQTGIYTVIVNGAVGSATNSVTLTVTKAEPP